MLRHYGLLKDIRNNYNPRYRESEYSITVKHEGFLKEAPKYAIKHEFKLKSDKNTDRVSNYPRIQDLSNEDLIHYYFNKEQYAEYAREEDYPSTFRKTQVIRVVRIYPKDLEPNAEKAAFEIALRLKFERDISTMVKVVFDFEPEVLHKVQDYSKQEHLSNTDLYRVNTIAMEDLSKVYVKDLLDKAFRMKDYIEASIRDLQQLYEKVPETYEDFKELAYPKLEAYIIENAPLMMTSANELERDLAAKVFTGGNKGLI